MYRVKRVKRDSAENIYRHCKLSGTCPPDVENKIENNTLADRLLRIFGSLIYLGGLGIGSGQGSGAATGIRPLPEEVPLPETVTPSELPQVPETVRPSVRPRPSRPNTFGVPIDPISSAGNTPRVVGAGESAIVPLSEGGLPDPTLIGTGAGAGEGLNNYEVFTNVTTDTVTSVGGHPTPVAGQNENIALLEITPEEHIANRIAVTSTEPSTGYTIIRTSLPVETDLNIFVDPRISGTTVGEEIELEPINTIQQFEIEEANQRTSTPSRLVERTIGRARELYNRFVEQVPTRNIDFLGQASRAVQFEFENPAFTADVTLEFERDVQQLAAAPDPNFTDVIRLDRPIFSQAPEGNVRVSRLGTKGNIRTRSGTVLKQRVHYFYDLSPISTYEPSAADQIELNIIGESSDMLSIVDELTQGTPVDIFGHYSEEALLDFDDQVVPTGRLEVFTAEEDELQIIPTLISDLSARGFIELPDLGSLVAYPNIISTTLPADVIEHNTQPAVYLDIYGPDYYLHPALQKRKKRKRSDMF